MTEPKEPRSTPTPLGDAGPTSASSPSVQAPSSSPQPDRPARDWREPPWFPPRDGNRRSRDRRPNVAAIVAGLVILAVGVYYFLDRTLGIAMPAIQWGSIWPILLIVLGGLILLRSLERR
jgi:hypothetical protein